MSHWAQQYVGLPWEPSGFGPTAFNCWGLVWWVQDHHFSRQVPRYLIDPRKRGLVIRQMTEAAEGHPDWVRLTAPEDGCVVALSESEAIHHVGVYVDVDRGIVLHACEGKGVLGQPLATMSLAWHRILFYRHASWPTSLK